MQFSLKTTLILTSGQHCCFGSTFTRRMQLPEALLSGVLTGPQHSTQRRRMSGVLQYIGKCHILSCLRLSPEPGSICPRLGCLCNQLLSRFLFELFNGTNLQTTTLLWLLCSYECCYIFIIKYIFFTPYPSHYHPVACMCIRPMD